MSKNKHNGFTLLEIIVTLAIIALAIGFTAPNAAQFLRSGNAINENAQAEVICNSLVTYASINEVSFFNTTDVSSILLTDATKNYIKESTEAKEVSITLLNRAVSSSDLRSTESNQAIIYICRINAAVTEIRIFYGPNGSYDLVLK